MPVSTADGEDHPKVSWYVSKVVWNSAATTGRDPDPETETSFGDSDGDGNVLDGSLNVAGLPSDVSAECCFDSDTHSSKRSGGVSTVFGWVTFVSKTKSTLFE